MTGKRKWQTGEDLRIEAGTLFGESRVYTFKELNQEHGSELFHHYVMVVINQWEKIKELIDKFKEARSSASNDDGVSLKELIGQAEIVARLLPEVFSWTDVKRLASKLLSDHKVELEQNGEPTTCVAGESGFSDVKGDPLEIYHALAFSILANWPKYIIPLLQAAPGDSTQGSEPGRKQNSGQAQ